MLNRASLLPLLLVQLLGTTDFMLVMPLGPSLAQGFNIPVENTAWLSGVFAICAALSGVLFSKYLDQYSRKKLLGYLLLVSAGLFFISAALDNFVSWVTLRGLIGFVSTPIAALSMAIAIDMSEQHRAKAMAFMSLGFSLSAVVGVPLGLWLASLTHWQMIYWVEGVLACLLSVIIFTRLPDSNLQNEQNEQTAASPLTLKQALSISTLRNGLILLCVSLFAAFLIIPHLAAILQFNFSVPFSDLGSFYAVGGIATMVLTLLTGKLHSHLSPVWLLLVASALALFFLWAGFVFYWLPPLLIFVAFMSLNGARNVIIQTHLSHLPAANQRAGFVALLTTLRNVATAFAAFISSHILISHGQQPLENVTLLIVIGSVFIVLTPVLLRQQSHRRVSP